MIIHLFTHYIPGQLLLFPVHPSNRPSLTRASERFPFDLEEATNRLMAGSLRGEETPLVVSSLRALLWLA